MPYENNNFEPIVYLLKTCWFSGYFGSAWDEVNFPDSVELCLGGLKMLVRPQCSEQCWHSIEAASSAFPFTNSLEVGESLEHSQDNRLKLTKGISHSIWHQQQKLGKSRRRGGIHHYIVCLLEQSLHILKFYSQGSGWTLPADWKKRINTLFFICFCKLPFSWSTRLFPSDFLSTLFCWGGSDGAACGDVASNQGHPTTQRNFSPYPDTGPALQRQLNDLSQEVMEPDCSWIYTSQLIGLWQSLSCRTEISTARAF